MTSPLFRQEALESNKQRLLGDVFLVGAMSFWIFTLLIVISVIIIGCFLGFNTYSRRETVVDYLVPNQGVMKLYTPFTTFIVYLVLKGIEARSMFSNASEEDIALFKDIKRFSRKIDG